MLVTPYAYMRVKLDRWRSAMIKILSNRKVNKKITKALPKNPHSSPTVQKIKSVSCSGTKL